MPVAARSDNFYYIEVYDIQQMRDMKINSVFELNCKSAVQYLNGSQISVQIAHHIYTALFWKNKFSAEHRIELISKNCPGRYSMKIVEMTRQQFIDAIPDETKLKGYALFYWKKNKELKTKEVSYEKLISKHV